jgi:hypothetical protein
MRILHLRNDLNRVFLAKVGESIKPDMDFIFRGAIEDAVADRVVTFPVDIPVAFVRLPKNRFVRLLKGFRNGFPEFAEPG